MTNTMTREATWSKVGTDIREATSVAEALKIAGMDYEVVKVPVYLSNGYKIPKTFATKKKGTDETFGIVGDDYTIVQNSEAFSFVDGIIPEGLTFEKAGEVWSRNYIIASLPKQYILDDGFKPYVIFQNSHAGYSTLKVAICPLRIVCQNQFTIAFRNTQNKISLRHSASIHGKMVEAQEVLQGVASYMDTFARNAQLMATQKISDQQVASIIDEYFIIDENASTRKINSTEEKRTIFLNAYNADDNQNFRGTVWGMANAFSDYITHLQPGRKTENAETSKFGTVTFNTSLMENFMDLVRSKA